MTTVEARSQIPAWIDDILVGADKIEVHRRGIRHKAVSVFVTDGRKFLLQQRATGKYHTPGLWANTCCTHPHWGEAPLDCAIRRLRQELGIDGLQPVFSTQVEYRADVGGGMTEHEVVDVFVARAGPDLRLCIDPAEVMATRWLGLDELRGEIAQNPDDFSPWLKIYLADHHEKIFGHAAITDL